MGSARHPVKSARIMTFFARELRKEKRIFRAIGGADGAAAAGAAGAGGVDVETTGVEEEAGGTVMGCAKPVKVWV